MYRYDEFDQTFVDERVAQFRDQVARRLAGELTEDQFKPLRLMNGLYLQLHAYMLRVAIPYGTLSSRQMRKLAHIARTYDKGYGHFTTRQNIQYNWPKLEEVPDVLADLAAVEMHAIQTSGNCIRNVTADQFAGVAADEIEDPRVWAEILRQWSTLAPGVLLPAAQVQDRGHRRAARPRGDRRCTTSACGMCRNDGRARSASRSSSAAAWAARRSSAKSIRELPAEAAPALLSRSDPARLQPLRPARQQVQGAHQDPGARDRAPRNSPGRSRRNGQQLKDAALDAAGRRDRAHRGLFRAAGLRRPRPRTIRPSKRSASTDPAFARWVEDQRACGTRCPATPSSPSR